MEHEKKVQRCKRIISDGLRAGKVARAQAPSRSTGQRRQFQESHKALLKVREVLSER